MRCDWPRSCGNCRNVCGEHSLVLCLDEVDMVFEHEKIAADFFGLLRNWHEMGKTSAMWKRFRLVVVHSTEVYIPMNINQSPFNVGLAIDLPEFTADQVQAFQLHSMGLVDLRGNEVGFRSELYRVYFADRLR
jgi:hypothetical protein